MSFLFLFSEDNVNSCLCEKHILCRLPHNYKCVSRHKLKCNSIIQPKEQMDPTNNCRIISLHNATTKEYDRTSVAFPNKK